MKKILLFLLKRYRDKYCPKDDKVADIGTAGRSLDDTIKLIKLTK